MIRGIGMVTVSGFIAEVGGEDIGRFDSHKQLQKLAGYAIVANNSENIMGKDGSAIMGGNA